MYQKIKIAFCYFFLLSLGLGAQAINTEFGKNRVQYHDDHLNWSRYETENFVTYWYGKARNIAQPVLQLAELDHEEIQKILEHTLSNKIEIIVYIDLSDLKQSNIGLDEAFTNKSKTTKVDGNKISVYFDGDHQHLRDQIRKGIASVYLNSILYGSSLQEIVQNALLLNLPDWFSEGLIAYSGSNWDRYIEDELRDLMRNPDYSKFDKLAIDHPRVAGHSLWNYISKTFGSSTIANIVYLTRINRNLNNSFLFTLGLEYDVLKDNWASYYQELYNAEKGRLVSSEKLNKVKLKNKKGVPVSRYRISSDGQYLAYVTNDRSKERVIVRNIETGEEKTIFKNGYKNIFQEPDYNYPLIAWHPSYPELTIIYEKNDIAKVRKVDVKNNTTEDQDLTTNFQRVYSISYIRPDEYLLSASTDGYSDLYIYEADKRHHTRITEDFYDDLDAEVIYYDNKKAILFRSNRPDLSLEKNKIDTILPIDNFDLFLLKGFRSTSELVRLTATEKINERAAFQSGQNEITFIHGNTGIDNAYTLDIKSRKTTAITNSQHNLITHHVSANSDYHFYNYYQDGNYQNFQTDLSINQDTKPYKTNFAKEKQAEGTDVTIPFLPEEEEESPVLTEGMKFQSEFDDVEDLLPLAETQSNELSTSMFEKYFKDYFSESYYDGKRVVKFKPMRASASRERFRLDKFVSKFDNEVLFEGLESYTGENKELNGVPVGLLMKGIVKDLLEDYEITVGLRAPLTFKGYEYFITLDNNKRLIDRRLAFYRKSNADVVNEEAFPPQREKRHAFLGLYRLKYPFNIYQSVRLTTSLRFDKYFLQSTEPTSFNADLAYEKRLSLKAEYVFDNSFDVSINIKNGTRLKVYAEGINEFDMELNNGFDVDFSTGITGILGIDARHYIPLFKRSLLALRVSAATSTGNKRVVYYLGGVEGWIAPNSEENIPTPGNENSSFKVLAPQLRGFRNNIRNGNTFALSNAELRVPIAHYIGLSRSNMNFLRNFQICSFFDAGLAWYGVGPDASDNTLNSVNISSPTENPIITINARYFRQPIVYGYGFGLRSTVLGYFVKADYAWGVETGIKRRPKLYISLGKDF